MRALENEMLLRIKRQGLDIIPKILIVSVFIFSSCWFLIFSIIFLEILTQQRLVLQGDQADT